jgi:hypothetical protein
MPRRNVLPPGLANIAFIGQNATFQHVLTTALQARILRSAASAALSLAAGTSWQLAPAGSCNQGMCPLSLPRWTAVPMAGGCAAGRHQAALPERPAGRRGCTGGGLSRRMPCCCCNIAGAAVRLHAVAAAPSPQQASNQKQSINESCLCCAPSCTTHMQAWLASSGPKRSTNSVWAQHGARCACAALVPSLPPVAARHGQSLPLLLFTAPVPPLCSCRKVPRCAGEGHPWQHRRVWPLEPARRVVWVRA